jgi:hypothetical protein
MEGGIAVIVPKPSNNRPEFARVARPTRKSEALVLAAQPERWA